MKSRFCSVIDHAGVLCMFSWKFNQYLINVSNISGKKSGGGDDDDSSGVSVLFIVTVLENYCLPQSISLYSCIEYSLHAPCKCNTCTWEQSI